MHSFLTRGVAPGWVISGFQPVSPFSEGPQPVWKVFIDLTLYIIFYGIVYYHLRTFLKFFSLYRRSSCGILALKLRFYKFFCKVSTHLSSYDKELFLLMSRSRYKIYETEYPSFLTSSIVEGIPLFANPEISTIILEGLHFLQESREVVLHAYVIMTNEKYQDSTQSNFFRSTTELVFV